jgi:ATP-dependent helicase/nuclease subunit B
MNRVATIPAGQPFVDALAAGLLAEAGDDPLSLADTLVLLPTRRACRSLRDAFLRRSAGRPLLLPRIQPLGELDADELMLDGTLELALPPAIGALRRQLLLARLLAPLGWTVEHGLRLAGDLAALLDELQTERIPLERFDGLVPEQLAEHWQSSRELLEIVLGAWPAVLAEEGALDPADRRHRVLTALAGRWREAPPEGRIVAAGSTGSIPGTRALLQVIADLPRGTVVLPGLDQTMDERSWRAIEPSHPQHGLKQLVEVLGVARDEVVSWPAPGIAGSPAARSRLLAEAVRPVSTIDVSHHLASPPADAAAGLSIEEHPDVASEALALALRMRATLEAPGLTAALVTPDRHLARRVAAELRRWQIEVDDSAGTPLDQTAPGGFLLLVARLIVEDVPAVTLLAVLKHPLARGGQDQAALRREARALERDCLRGPRLVGGFSGILAELRAAERQTDSERRRARLEGLAAWLEGLEAIARPFAELARRPEADLAELMRAHLAFAEALAADRRGSPGDLFAREAGEAAAALLSDLLDAGRDGHRIDPAGYPALLAQLMAARAVRPRAPRHPRLLIWGQLEARLQHADLLLLGGLNEGVWPAFVDPGPWLSRSMRQQLGLPAVERRIGLSAHDLVQAASAPEVVLSRSEKDAQANPTVPSRWLVRLQTLLKADDAAAETSPAEPGWSAWARQIDETGVSRPEERPRPTPPVHARPRKLSVSDVGSWMRDPYDLYARRVLRLSALDALDADPGALERGIIIHAVLERFVREFPDALPPDAEQRLLHIGTAEFEKFVHRPQVAALWWPRFEQVARWVIARERALRPELARVHGEVTGELALDGPAGPFVIRARADRLERHPDGRITVIDYKTGQLPERKEVLTGRQPQLALEAAMVEAGAFEEIGRAELCELRFWRLKGDEAGGEERDAARMPPAELARAALEGLAALIAHYDRPETAYPARPKPRVAWRGDYDHLARRGEWSA